MSTGFVVAVVLVAGLVVLASFLLRKRGYSHNQRVVLSGVAIALLIWSLVPRDLETLKAEPGKAVMAGLGVVVLIAAVRYLGRQE